MPVNHPIRALCVRIVCWKGLDNAVLLVILCNSIYMLVEPARLEEGSADAALAAAVDWVTMSIFTVELLVRMVALGLFGHSDAFINDAWNLLDFAVVLPFWVHVAFPDMPALGAMRLLRAFRRHRDPFSVFLGQHPSLDRLIHRCRLFWTNFAY